MHNSVLYRYKTSACIGYAYAKTAVFQCTGNTAFRIFFVYIPYSIQGFNNSSRFVCNLSVRKSIAGAECISVSYFKR